ncbi:MAG: hypothetical protein ABI986_03030, partial [Chloroflexota bacterium]
MESEPHNENEVRKQPGVERVYRNDQIAVSWGRSCELNFERLDDGLQEAPQQETTIEARVNGPLFVRGPI